MGHNDQNQISYLETVRISPALQVIQVVQDSLASQVSVQVLLVLVLLLLDYWIFVLHPLTSGFLSTSGFSHVSLVSKSFLELRSQMKMFYFLTRDSRTAIIFVRSDPGFHDFFRTWSGFGPWIPVPGRIFKSNLDKSMKLLFSIDKKCFSTSIFKNYLWFFIFSLWKRPLNRIVKMKTEKIESKMERKWKVEPLWECLFF